MTHQLSWIKFTEEALQALINRDLQRASTLVGAKLGPYFITDDAVRRWNNRLNQFRQDSRTLDWIARIVMANGEVVGHAGFHGPPDQVGMVEVAYSVVPAHRGQGYAKSMLRDLLKQASSEPEIRVVRATIRPDNVASLATIRPFGFVHKGEQLDDIDGLEYIFEVDPESFQTEVD
ncbi:N-acetyltransferase [Fibrisoma montanum]|uniref:N-acetyltransferase n=1 Tax=Fibrisoma montanum TaxID=2305895 RepID=A0A418MF36_9BACT|nr:GNAT family N-acetyltransferase [Fibrisoma montanum]RIV25386.1 N-acetyltransferase [Fibrisoma montanum]